MVSALDLLSQPNRRQSLTSRVLAGTNAIWHANSAISITGQGQAWVLLARKLDTSQAFEMTNVVLRHGGLPSVHAGEERLGGET